MSLFLETGYVSLNKEGEELCGDKVECITENGFTTLVLADGLGSGVKANILATLTSKILCTMIANGLTLEDCVETILKSLPVCKVRGVAYSTFSILHLNGEGVGYLTEFDNPQAIFIRSGKCQNLERKKQKVMDKTLYFSEVSLLAGDLILLLSDGVEHAGIGKLLNFGWARGKIQDFLTENFDEAMSARAFAALLGAACKDLYMDKPGDDTTVAAVRVRESLPVSLMVGPPLSKEQDDFVISSFLSGGGKKAVCGGTSSQLVAKYLQKKLTTSFDFVDKEVPPIGYIEGVDLTTEGVLTLRKLLELSEKYLSTSDVSPKVFKKKDGASQLADLLFEQGTDITFYVGQSINAAHLELPISITMKLKLVESLTTNLKKMGKTVTLNYV